MRVIKLFAGFAGLIAVIVSVPLIATGVALLAWAGDDATATMPSVYVNTGEHALVADDIDVFAGDRHTFLPDVSQVSVIVHDDEPLFVGLAARRDVQRYLASGDGDPMSQDFWVYSSEGETADLDWDLDPGRWSAVVMNTDGSTGVDATFQVTVPSAPLRVAGVVLALLGVGSGVVGTLLVIAAWSGRRPASPEVPSAVPAA
jgi:hypothetical protein